MRCSQTSQIVYSRLRMIALIFSAACACYCGPGGVTLADRAVMSFLIHYSAEQASTWRNTGSYGDLMFSDHRAAGTLSDAYLAVKDSGYECRSQVSVKSFRMWCAPEQTSRLQIGYFMDDSRVVRMDGSRSATQTSPARRLDPSESIALNSDVLPGSLLGASEPGLDFQ